MAKTGNVRGDVVVGDSGNPELVVPLSLATGTVTGSGNGKARVAANTTFAIPFSGIVIGQLLVVKIRNADTLAPKVAILTMNATALPVKVSEAIFNIQTPSGTALTGLSVTTDNDGITHEVEWVVAGT